MPPPARAVVLLLALSGLDVCSGHGLLTIPRPRQGTNEAGQNKGSAAAVSPCGLTTNLELNTRNAPVVTFTPGDLATTVSWSCNAGHGGTCDILLSTAGTDPGTGDGTPLAGTFVDIAGGSFGCCSEIGVESRPVAIPAATSVGAAVLQWHWDGDQHYNDCADVVIATAPGAATSAAALASSTADGGAGGSVWVALAAVAVVVVVVVGLIAVVEKVKLSVFNSAEFSQVTHAKDAGLISEDEYQAARQQVLAEGLKWFDPSTITARLHRQHEHKPPQEPPPQPLSLTVKPDEPSPAVPAAAQA